MEIFRAFLLLYIICINLDYLEAKWCTEYKYVTKTRVVTKIGYKYETHKFLWFEDIVTVTYKYTEREVNIVQ